MRPFRNWLPLLLLASTALCSTAQAQQTYPTRPITLLVPFPAGGQADALARATAPALQKELGQPVIVENTAGVGGALGAQRVLNLPADGYTLMFGTPIELIQTPMAVAGAKYQPDAFRMVAPVVSTYLMMVVRSELPVNSVAEFVALARSRSGAAGLNYGSVGRGSAYHLVAERFAQDTGVKMVHVPYRGAQQMITDLAGGQIDMGFLAMGGPVPGLLQSGKFKAIGYTGTTRHPAFPNVATLNESKLVKDFNFDLWGAVMANRNVPEAVVAKVHAAVNTALRQPQFRKSLEATGVIPAEPMALPKAAAFYASEITRYQRVGQSIDLQPE